MIPFMIVLLGALVGFAISFKALNGPESSISAAFAYNYKLMFGDFNLDDDTSVALWILFVISTFFMPLVMLNMLIAIMSDTYGRVMAEIIP